MRRLTKPLALVAMSAAVLGIAGVSAARQYFKKQPSACATCHAIEPYYQTWRGVRYEDSAHRRASSGRPRTGQSLKPGAVGQSVQCVDCHQATLVDQVREVVSTVTGRYETPLPSRRFSRTVCLNCHVDYPQLAELTKGDLNPHEGHWGEIECGLCHKEHRPEDDYCARCHVAIRIWEGIREYRVP